MHSTHTYTLTHESLLKRWGWVSATEGPEDVAKRVCPRKNACRSRFGSTFEFARLTWPDKRNVIIVAMYSILCISSQGSLLYTCLSFKSTFTYWKVVASCSRCLEQTTKKFLEECLHLRQPYQSRKPEELLIHKDVCVCVREFVSIRSDLFAWFVHDV